MDDYKQNIDKLIDNRLDILVENRLVVLRTIEDSNDMDKIKELTPALNETPVYGWFSKKKNSQQMIDGFDKKIVEIKQDGTFEKIYNSYNE